MELNKANTTLSQPFIYHSKCYTEKIKSSSISKHDLKALYTILALKSNEAAEKELGIIPNCTEELKAAFAQLKNKLWVQIWGENDEYLSGDHESVFENSRLPKKITRVLFSSYQCYQVISKSTMHNWFDLQLDFKKADLLDFSKITDQANQNGSYFKIQGTDETWVGGVYHAIHEFLKDKKLSRNWLYSPLSYDALLYMLFFPLVFRTAYRIGSYFKLSTLPTPLMVAIYVYIFIVSIYLFRFIFNYTKWLFPLIELKNGMPQKHRYLLFLIAIGIIGAATYDLIKVIATYLIGY